ncbi:DoxX family protein [Rufibacter roseolus]|uniref:DoxX family protein n=1 Tax=Rufibacter roseolus TaxID=2817375 RepID=UPI001B308317|nr:DoxX family protein [Rufibacter roseolus]
MADQLALSAFLDRYKPYAAVLLRLAFGFHLIYFTQDNVFSYERMLEFRDFLEVRGVPFPLAGAIVSVAVQFLCGIFLVVGWQVRLAGFFILVNFILAFIIAHRGQSYEQFFQPVQLIAVGLFFLLHGAGTLSLDHYLHQRRTERTPATSHRQTTF